MQTTATLTRDLTITEDRLSGDTYRELAKKYNISKQRVGQILSKPEIKDILDTGAQQLVALVPQAIDAYVDLLKSKSESVRRNASKDMLQAVGIFPSHTQPQFLINIYNDYSGNVSPLMQGVLAQALGQGSVRANAPGLPEPDVIDAEFNEIIDEYDSQASDNLSDGGE